MASHVAGVNNEWVREWARAFMEAESVAVASASARTFSVQRAKRIEVVEIEDPELRRASTDELEQKTADRLKQYNIKVEGKDTGPAMRILIGMLLQEIDDLRAIVEASRD